MKKFSFGVPTEICGKVYNLDLTGTGVEKEVKRIDARMKKALDDARKTGNVEDAVELARQFVDTVLGKGSFEEIFTGRDISAFDVASLLAHLAGVIRESREEIRIKAGG